MIRVKKAELDTLLGLINRPDPDLPARRYPEVGYYYLMPIRGGYMKLVQIINEGGGVRDVLPHLGYVNSRRMAENLRTFMTATWERSEEHRRQIPQLRAVLAPQYAERYWQAQEAKKPKRRRVAAAV